MDYGDLDDAERSTHDKVVISAKVDAQLPVIAEPGRPGNLRVDVDYIWLSGLTAYWIIGTLVLWGILASARVQPAITLAIVVATVVFAGYVAHWFNHHAKLKAAKRNEWVKYETRSREAVKRKEAREALHEALWAARSAQQDTEPG